MNLEEAIKILKSEQKHSLIPNMDDWNDAICLGIEALERFRTLRAFGKDVGMPLLKGEKRD